MSPGAVLVRRMLLTAIILPPVLGALVWQGSTMGLYGAGAGLLIVSLAVMCVIGAVTWLTARAVDEADGARRSALDALRVSEERARRVIEGAHEAFVSIDGRGTITDWNAQAERVFGWGRDEAIGRSLAETIIPERFREPHRQGLRRFLEVGKGEMVDKLLALDALHRDGHELPVELTIAPQRVPGGWQFNAFIRDVTERKRLEAERDRFNAELERSNEELEQFAYVASHDLTEPLRTIGGFVQLLQHRYRGKLDEQGDRFIEATASGVERMEAMIDALLKLSRIGQTKVGVELVDCEQAVEQASLNLRPVISEHKAKLQVGELPEFLGEPALIGELFQNLISNAVKYGDPESPVVSVSAERIDGEWIFSVEDNGAGIDPKQATRVFEMFKRLHDRDQAGAGIGLAICKRIVDKHGGRIWVEPRSDGGSAFRFAIPAARHSASDFTRRGQTPRRRRASLAG